MSESLTLSDPPTPLETRPVLREVEKRICRECVGILDASDNFCRFCGSPTPRGEALLGGSAHAAIRPAPLDAKPSWTESPWVVLPALFVFLGPFALPMLLRSRCFSGVWKVALTVAVLAITVGLSWYVYAAVAREMEQINRLLR